MKRIKTLTNRTMKNTMVKGDAANARHHVSQLVRHHAQSEIRAVRMLRTSKRSL